MGGRGGAWWLVSLLFALGSNHAMAQVEPEKNVVYFELLGTCVFGSINYERRLGRAWPLRIGVGYLPETFLLSQTLMPTVTVGRLFGSGKHLLEVAAGSVLWVFLNGETPGVYATATVGYRYQPGSQLFFRIGAAPLVRVGNSSRSDLPPLAVVPGVSLGRAW